MQRKKAFDMILANFESSICLMAHRQSVAKSATRDCERYCGTPKGDEAWTIARLNYAAAHAAYAAAKAYTVWLDADAPLIGRSPTFKKTLAAKKKEAGITQR